MAGARGWTVPMAMKLQFGYFNDQAQMNRLYRNHYCDSHPANILVNVVNNGSEIQYFWADPGKTSSVNGWSDAVGSDFII
jgi:hypothetical protein